MKFNHLLNQKERLQFCKNRNLVVCKWKPVSEGQATAGNNVCVSMLCDECGARTEKFLHSEDYKTHEKVILKEVNNDQTSKQAHPSPLQPPTGEEGHRNLATR